MFYADLMMKNQFPDTTLDAQQETTDLGNTNAKSEEHVDIRKTVTRRLYAVLENNLDVHPRTVGGKPVIEKCVASVMSSVASFSKQFKFQIKPESNFIAFPERVEALKGGCIRWVLPSMNLQKPFFPIPSC